MYIYYNYSLQYNNDTYIIELQQTQKTIANSTTNVNPLVTNHGTRDLILDVILPYASNTKLTSQMSQNWSD